MNYKINCQIIDILLNNSNEFTNKYTSVSSGSFEFDTLLEDYYLNKNMRNITTPIILSTIKNIAILNNKRKMLLIIQFDTYTSGVILILSKSILYKRSFLKNSGSLIKLDNSIACFPLESLLIFLKIFMFLRSSLYI